MSNGIGKNPLNDISKAYLESVAESAVPGKPAEKLGAVTAIPKSEQEAAKERLLAKAKAKREKMKEALDPVGQEDADIDNDGDVDKSDKYLGKRRKAIAKAMKKRMKKEEVEVVDEANMTPEQLKKINDRIAKQGIQYPTGKKQKTSVALRKEKEMKKEEVEQVIEGDGDPCWDTHKQVGMKKKGNRMVPNCVPKTKSESFSNWRSELTEVAPVKDDEEKEIKEKKVNNKITINPKLGEEVVSEMGGTLIEMVEYDEFDGMVEGVYFELQEEGYTEDDIEEALEWVLTEARVTYGSDTESPRQQMMKKAKGRLKFLGRKVGEKMASAKAQVAAYNKAREAKQSASDTARRVKKSAAEAPKKAKKGLKAKIKGAAQKVVDRMSEETEDPKEKQMLAKKKTMMMKQQMLDRQRLQAQQQGKLPSGHRVESTEDSLRDRRMERGGVDGNVRYDRPAKNVATGSKKKYDGMSALEKVKAELEKKHGKGAIANTKK